MKKILSVVLLLAAMAVGANAQLLLEEDFNYTDGSLLTGNGWSAHSGAGTQAITVTTGGGLTYTGYVNSGIGNAALVDNNGEDINKTLSATQTSGTLYYSFLVRITTIGAAGYATSLYNTSSQFAARVFAQTSGAGFNFGIGNSTATYGSTVFTLGTTYLCIVKYDVSATGACSLWVFSSGVPADESSAGSPEVTSSGSGQASISAVMLRQFNAGQNYTFDGLRVATSWTHAPLPVELTSFNAIVKGRGVELVWNTATEKDNYGFEIEKNVAGGWNKIGFVEGFGTTNSAKNYTFTDANAKGNVQYRLKQIDRDGKFEYSNIVEAKIALTANDFTLGQNYPNPFNPNTTISFAMQNNEQVNVSVYNSLGQMVATLFNGVANANEVYNLDFNGKDLSSGTYFYSLRSASRNEVKKMSLMK